jgi:hypothetical protein
MPPAKYDGSRQREFALWLSKLARKAPLGGFELSENAATIVKILTAQLGERQLPSRPRYEAHAQLMLERSEPAAHRRKRHAEPATRSRQAASLSNSHENLDSAEPVPHSSVFCSIPYKKRRLHASFGKWQIGAINYRRACFTPGDNRVKS